MTTKPTVLMADDDPIIIERATRLLCDIGFNVISHDDGLGLSSIILRNRPEIVLVDVMMPRLAGDQIVTLIKENNLFEDLDIVFIFYSSKDADALSKLVKQSGAEGAIQKSVDDETFKSLFLKMVQRKLPSLMPAPRTD